jgi:hypothetical protein
MGRECWLVLVSKRPKHISRKIETTLDQFFIIFKHTIFVLDTHNIIIPRRGEGGKDRGPIDISRTGQPLTS